MPSPKSILLEGKAILDPVLGKAGFEWRLQAEGQGSGGGFCRAEYIRKPWRLSLSFRHSLGLVTYHLGARSLEHADYMRLVLDEGQPSQYPGFSQDPLDGFRHLASDLTKHGKIFLDGQREAFEDLLARAAANKGTSRLP